MKQHYLVNFVSAYAYVVSTLPFIEIGSVWVYIIPSYLSIASNIYVSFLSSWRRCGILVSGGLITIGYLQLSWLFSLGTWALESWSSYPHYRKGYVCLEYLIWFGACTVIVLTKLASYQILWFSVTFVWSVYRLITNLWLKHV